MDDDIKIEDSATSDISTIEHHRATAAFGSILLVIGVTITCLAMAEASGGLPFSLPRSWYTNRPIWYLLALASFGGAWKLLRQEPDGRLPSEAVSRRFRRAVLYTRAGCHLCDEMRQGLDRYAQYFPPIEVIDIDSDPALVAKFTDCVPVLEIDGRVRFRGRLNEVLLRRLIDATPERGASAQPAQSPSLPED